ncbi:MAG: hypothetical protein R3D03_04850 [Geminicoccaceae bacterium]
MPTYLHPGVYIEEIPSGARPIEAAGTSTAVIIGYATKGPIGKPELLFNYGQYVEQFGGIGNRHGLEPPVDYMGHTVQAFFDNGGGKAYIVRLAPGAEPASAKLVIPNEGATTFADIETFLEIKGINPGSWAKGLEIELAPDDENATPPTFTMRIGRRNEDGELVAQELFGEVTFVEGDPAYLPGIVNDTSALIKIDTSDLDLENSDNQELYRGSLTSGDLSDLAASDIVALAGSNFTVILDDGAPTGVESIVVTLTTTTELAKIAEQIEAAVSDSVTAGPLADFTCVVSGNRLVLTAGSGTITSSVRVEAGTTDAAAPLLLIGHGRDGTAGHLSPLVRPTSAHIERRSEV